jgi:hypothetical protein
MPDLWWGGGAPPNISYPAEGGGGGSGDVFGLDGIMSPVALGGMLLGAGSSAAVSPAANRSLGARAVAPKAGTITGLWVFMTAVAGNIRGAIYDTGQATANTRTRLWLGNAIAPGANVWNFLGNPGLVVTRGQNLDLVTWNDTVGVTYDGMAISSFSPPIPAAMDSGVALGSADHWLSWVQGIAGSPAATIGESFVSAQPYCPLIIARVT